MKSALLGVGMLLLFSCDESSPGMTMVTKNNQDEVAKNMQATKPLITELPPEDVYYGPQLIAHDKQLVDLLSRLSKGKVGVRKEMIEEGVFRYYIEVTLPAFSEPIIIHPYDNIGSDSLGVSKIIAGPNEYIIAHSILSETTAQGIVSGGVNRIFQSFQGGRTVTHAHYTEPGGFIKVE